MDIQQTQTIASTSTSRPPIRAFWPPWLAGLALGLVLLMTFVMTGHGLGATGFTTRLAAWLGFEVATTSTQANAYLGPMLENGNPLPSWITWEVLGVAIGALAAAYSAGRWRIQIAGNHGGQRIKRLVLALGGGMLAGLGARIAAGCTSGVGLSGGAVLSIGAFVFLGAFFTAGLIVTRLARLLNKGNR